jgi:arylsulfatase A-like enzyme
MPDPQLVDAAEEYLRTHRPDLFFMQLDTIDGIGHSHGYGSKAYLQQVSTVDALVGRMIDAIRQAGMFDNSLFVVASDHGGFDRSHGSDHPDCMTVFWSCRGPGVARGAELDSDVNIMDTAAVVAHGLGLERPPAWDAKKPAGVFAE